MALGNVHSRRRVLGDSNGGKGSDEMADDDSSPVLDLEEESDNDFC